MTCILLTPQVSSIFVCQLRSPQPSSCFGRRKKFPSQCNYFHCPRTLCVVISNVADDAIGFNRFISCSHAPDCPHFAPLHQCHEFSKIKCNMYHHLINSFFWHHVIHRQHTNDRIATQKIACAKSQWCDENVFAVCGGAVCCCCCRCAM